MIKTTPVVFNAPVKFESDVTNKGDVEVEGKFVAGNDAEVDGTLTLNTLGDLKTKDESFLAEQSEDNGTIVDEVGLKDVGVTISSTHSADDTALDKIDVKFESDNVNLLDKDGNSIIETAEVDLSGYSTTAEMNTAIADAVSEQATKDSETYATKEALASDNANWKEAIEAAGTTADGKYATKTELASETSARKSADDEVLQKAYDAIPTITPTLTEGTEIASVAVGDTTTKLYAPSGTSSGSSGTQLYKHAITSDGEDSTLVIISTYKNPYVTQGSWINSYAYPARALFEIIYGTTFGNTLFVGIENVPSDFPSTATTYLGITPLIGINLLKTTSDREAYLYYLKVTTDTNISVESYYIVGDTGDNVQNMTMNDTVTAL